jgi:hypothetical protein
MEMNLYSEICKLDNMEGLNLDETHAIQFIKSHSCSTKLY